MIARLQRSRWAGILASALLVHLYVGGGAGWVLGFVALVPWLLTQDREPSYAGALLGAWLMSVAYTAAAFTWFGSAIGAYTGLGAPAGLGLLLLAAPLFQPQFIVYVLVRRGTGPGRLRAALAAVAAWVAAEALLPRLLGDTLGHGLYPSASLRQGAAIGGAAGLTLLLLLANEAVAAAIARRRQGVRAVATTLALALLPPLLLAGYGLAVLAGGPQVQGQPLRLGLVQANFVDYESLRRDKGAAAVVREVLDVHYAMSYDAVERQRADAVLWSETVYPTTFGHPKSEAGAELDREILGIVNAAGVPFVFGTYDRDAQGEYNAAAFVAPRAGLIGHYRKARPFPLTETVPAWLDGPLLRQWLPWAGAWRAGSGARVFPLFLADGREIPVLPLICLDDTDSGLAIDGARLGAQAILTMSNDGWFSDHQGQGAALHQAVAAFRSIETRLPQFRVTSNGFSAVIDATGGVLVGSAIGERRLLVGTLPVGPPPRTLMVMWGDWVGRACAVGLLLLGAAAAWRRWWPTAATAGSTPPAVRLPATAALLPLPARAVAGGLRLLARASLLVMLWLTLRGDGALQAGSLALVRGFAFFVLLPEVLAGAMLLAYGARLSIEQGALVFTRGRRRLELPLRELAAVEPWSWPIPAAGASLRLRAGGLWRYGLVLADPLALQRALAEAAFAATPPAALPEGAAPLLSHYAAARLALRRGPLHRGWAKFVLLPLALAVPAFRLHQHIAFGSSFGEAQAFGAAAFLQSFALWWAAWAIGAVLTATALRFLVEAGSLATAWLAPVHGVTARRLLEAAGLAALYLGLPAWLLLRVFAD